jgi:hypothetical protein
LQLCVWLFGLSCRLCSLASVQSSQLVGFLVKSSGLAIDTVHTAKPVCTIFVGQSINVTPRWSVNCVCGGQQQEYWVGVCVVLFVGAYLFLGSIKQPGLSAMAAGPPSAWDCTSIAARAQQASLPWPGLAYLH